MIAGDTRLSRTRLFGLYPASLRISFTHPAQSVHGNIESGHAAGSLSQADDSRTVSFR